MRNNHRKINVSVKSICSPLTDKQLTTVAENAFIMVADQLITVLQLTSGPVVVAMMFLQPGKHAGEGGDVETILGGKLYIALSTAMVLGCR